MKGNLATKASNSFTNFLGFRQLISLDFSFHWIFICISTLDGNVYYIDSNLGNEARNFGDVQELIDR
jgi:hypothetical protein